MINQIPHTLFPFSLQSSFLCLFSEWIPSGRADMDFTNNLSQIAGKLAADLSKGGQDRRKKVE